MKTLALSPMRPCDATARLVPAPTVPTPGEGSGVGADRRRNARRLMSGAMARGWVGFWGLIGGLLVLGARAQGIPDQPGQFFRLECGMSVATCAPFGPGQYVVGIIDTRNRALAPLGPTNWLTGMTHNDLAASSNIWNFTNLGYLFGLCLDDSPTPDIYVTATSVFGSGPNPGRIHRLSGTTGAISTFATLPGVGAPSLGNICFDKGTRQFFVSEFETGQIHCLNNAGAVVASYDHGVSRATATPPLPALPDSSGPGVATQLGRRVWGVQVYRDRLYYSVENENLANPSASLTNEIWSVKIQPSTSGPVFVGGTVRRENLVIPPMTGNSSEAVSDIAFSQDGRMLIAERGHPHQARTLEYTLTGTTWNGVHANLGSYGSHDNSAGGVDYDCSNQIFATGNALVLNTNAIYGIQISPAGGDTSASGIEQSVLIDLNGNTSTGTAYKGAYGDVEVYRCCDCLTFQNERLECLGTNRFTWSFCVTNTGALTNGHFVFLDLPAGVTVNPAIIDLNPLLLPGDGVCTNVTFTIDPKLVTNRVCFRLAAHTPDYAECCVVSKCLEVPSCCAVISHESVQCDPTTGAAQWSFSISNLSGSTVKYLYAIPDPAGCVSATPNVIVLTPPLPAGGTTNLSFNLAVTNSPCDVACLRMALHDSNLVACCAFTHCVSLQCKPGNHPPVVDCPPDYLSTCDVGAGKGYVIGAGVQDPEGNPLTVTWKVNGVPVKTNSIPAGMSASSQGVQLVRDYPAGTYVITLCVTDGNGPPVICTTRLEIGDHQPPRIQCPPDRVIEKWEYQLGNLTGTVVVQDNCTPKGQIVVTQNPPAGTILTAAHNCIQFTATDAAGNTATCMTYIDLVPVHLVGLEPAGGGSGVITATAPASFAIGVAGDIPATSAVEYWVNGVSIGRGAGADFRLSWSGVANGSYVVTAEATSKAASDLRRHSQPAYVYVGPAAVQPRTGAFALATVSGGLLRVSMATVAGENCAVEVCDDLADGRWRVIKRITGDGVLHVVEFDATGPTQFIRVRIE